MTFPHKIILHRLGLTHKDDKSSLQSRADTVDHAAIMACSLFKEYTHVGYETVASGRNTDDRRRLLSDQKLPFEQFQPRKLLISTARVMAMQAGTTVSYFLTDQLEVEGKREELVKEGKLTAKQADQLNEEWEQKEWSARWSTFGQKCIYGVVKFHAITLVMRFYERLLTGRVDVVTLDRLTRDPFKAAEVTCTRSRDSTPKLMGTMFELCFWSNLVAFLADYTVHQIILAFTYYMYCREKKRQRIQDREHEEENEGEDGAMAMSFVFKSSKLIVSRGLGLLGGAAGGAVGSYVYPGWGTTIGINFGDGLIASALEERT